MAWVPFAAMAASKIYDKLWGGQDKMKKVSTMTKEQQKLLNQMIGMLGGGALGQGYQGAIKNQMELMNPDSAATQRFADPYIQQFNQQTVPGLAERFAGMGAMGGGLSSSGFGQALGAAGANLQTQLAALKAGIGQQAAGNLMNQYSSMMGQVMGAQPFAYQQQAPGMGQSAFGAWAQSGFPGSQGFSNAVMNPQDWIVNNMPGSVV